MFSDISEENTPTSGSKSKPSSNVSEIYLSHRCENLKRIKVVWIYLSCDMNHWRAFVNTVMNLFVIKKMDNC
jgi:hypothetical protein